MDKYPDTTTPESPKFHTMMHSRSYPGKGRNYTFFGR